MYKPNLNTNELGKHIFSVTLFLIEGVGRNFVSQPCLVDQKTWFNLNTSSPPATSLGIVELFSESLIIKSVTQDLTVSRQTPLFSLLNFKQAIVKLGLQLTVRSYQSTKSTYHIHPTANHFLRMNLNYMYTRM